MAYQPVIDGTFVPRAAIEMVADGSASGVAVMVGSTLEEWKLFSLMDPSLHQTRPRRPRRADEPATHRRCGRRASSILTRRRARSEASRSRPPNCSPQSRPTAFSASRPCASRKSSPVTTARVYSYLFTWPSPAMGGVLGSCHALELGFVFGTNNVPGMPAFAGTGPAAEKLATEMQDAWLAFARSGDPSSKSAGEWKPYDESRRATMIFGATTKLEDAPRDEERRAWARQSPTQSSARCSFLRIRSLFPKWEDHLLSGPLPTMGRGLGVS